MRIQDFIDSRFFRKSYDAQQTLAEFARTTRNEVALSDLTDTLVGVVQETVQPESLSLWLVDTGEKHERRTS